MFLSALFFSIWLALSQLNPHLSSRPDYRLQNPTLTPAANPKETPPGSRHKFLFGTIEIRQQVSPMISITQVPNNRPPDLSTSTYPSSSALRAITLSSSHFR